jgi:hypothetical protein
VAVRLASIGVHLAFNAGSEWCCDLLVFMRVACPGSPALSGGIIRTVFDLVGASTDLCS